jgi:hypothetical protein
VAEYLIRNSLNPHKVIKCGVTFKHLVSKGDEGEPIWLVEVSTNELDKYGNSIPPEFINLLSFDNLDNELEKVTSIISAKIDWETLDEDTRPPFVSSSFPSSYYADIASNIELIISEMLPSAGIDIDSIHMTVNGYDVTSELTITGDPYEYQVKWEPFLRIYDTYIS